MTHSTLHHGLSVPQHPGPAAQSGYQVLPPDPQAMLVREKRGGRWPRLNLLIVVVAGVLAAEIAAPTHLKPSAIGGRAAANFYGAIMDESNRKELDLDEQKPYATARGEREAAASNWSGICAATAVLDREIAAYCSAMGQAYFNEALPPARTYRERYQAGR